MKNWTCVKAGGVSLGLAMVLLSSAAQATTKCDDPPTQADRKACAAAAEGPAELRRFVDRTKKIYGLHFWDYVDSSEATKVAAYKLDEDDVVVAHFEFESMPTE